MAKITLLSLAESAQYDDWARGAFTILKESASVDRFGVHTLTDDSDEADIILFAELRVDITGVDLKAIRRHPIYRRHRDKVFAYSSADYVVPRIPGIFTSIDRSNYNRSRTRIGPYLTIMPNPFVDFREMTAQPRYLFSFKGTLYTHPIRTQICTVLKDNPRGVIEDTGRESTRITTFGTSDERLAFWKGYADQMAESSFILCPRGRGPQSIRLFECMRMGRVPVIISDDWVAPEGIDWDQVSIRVSESDVQRIPAILEVKEPLAGAMGQRARHVWETHFAPEVLFHHFTEWCLDMKRTRRVPEALASLLCAPQVLRRDNLRLLIRDWKSGLRAGTSRS